MSLSAVLVVWAYLWFGEEEPDRGDNRGVEDGEHNVGLVFEVCESRGGNHDDKEVRELL